MLTISRAILVPSSVSYGVFFTTTPGCWFCVQSSPGSFFFFFFFAVWPYLHHSCQWRGMTNALPLTYPAIVSPNAPRRQWHAARSGMIDCLARSQRCCIVYSTNFNWFIDSFVDSLIACSFWSQRRSMNATQGWVDACVWSVWVCACMCVCVVGGVRRVIWRVLQWMSRAYVCMSHYLHWKKNIRFIPWPIISSSPHLLISL